MAGSRVYSMWLPDDLVEAVDVEAKRLGMTRNAYVRLQLESATARTRRHSDVLRDDRTDPVVVK